MKGNKRSRLFEIRTIWRHEMAQELIPSLDMKCSSPLFNLVCILDPCFLISIRFYSIQQNCRIEYEFNFSVYVCECMCVSVCVCVLRGKCQRPIAENIFSDSMEKSWVRAAQHRKCKSNIENCSVPVAEGSRTVSEEFSWIIYDSIH